MIIFYLDKCKIALLKEISNRMFSRRTICSSFSRIVGGVFASCTSFYQRALEPLTQTNSSRTFIEPIWSSRTLLSKFYFTYSLFFKLITFHINEKLEQVDNWTSLASYRSWLASQNLLRSTVFSTFFKYRQIFIMYFVIHRKMVNLFLLRRYLLVNSTN